MKYRSRTGKTISDHTIIADLTKSPKGILQNNGSSVSNYFSALFQYFIGIMAFISRSFLRINLGERTFGVLTLIAVIIFVKLTIIFPSAYTATYNELFGSDFTSSSSQEKYVLNVLTFFITFLYPLVVLLFGEFLKKGYTSEFLKEIDLSHTHELSVFLGIIILVTLGHLIDVFSRRRRQIVIHSFYRGDSVFFNWMEGRKLFGRKVTQIGIWMLIEPISIVATAVIIEHILDLASIARILYFSAGCLFIQEFRVYQENKRFELDLLDGQLDAAYAAELQKEYRESIESHTKGEQDVFRTTLAGSRSYEEIREASDSPYRVKVL